MQTALNLLKARKCIVITHEMNEDDLFIRHLVRPDNPVSEKIMYGTNLQQQIHLRGKHNRNTTFMCHTTLQ